ncbi:hypothetical protein BV25DRAFT_1825466 [Artomyces pyxidatus]|uniref:Uncharacterized protein n=1 Tax=Artomyces pyxidatus TaxID=48021 RepID=A0ACB8T0Y0_9AGAM|nr:hypothetical protein BV25DRAFT_1825466 [Artomyces pyxidatus]
MVPGGLVQCLRGGGLPTAPCFHEQLIDTIIVTDSFHSLNLRTSHVLKPIASLTAPFPEQDRQNPKRDIRG